MTKVSATSPLGSGRIVPYLLGAIGIALVIAFLAEAQEKPSTATVAGERTNTGSLTKGGRASDKDSLIVTPDYIIGPEDVLEIIVWRNADLSKVVTVRPDGRISLPLVGDIEATGLTPPQLTNSIVEKLRQYKETPTVSVIVQQVNSYGIYILGEVARPGRHFLKSKTTLIQAITAVGGFTPVAARNRIVLFRWVVGPNNELKEVKLKASYDEIVLRENSTQNVVLQPGDTIVVPSETMVLTN
jgi:polysaccharide export outer membrane protein